MEHFRRWVFDVFLMLALVALALAFVFAVFLSVYENANFDHTFIRSVIGFEAIAFMASTVVSVTGYVRAQDLAEKKDLYMSEALDALYKFNIRTVKDHEYWSPGATQDWIAKKRSENP